MGKQVVAQIVLDITPCVEDQGARACTHDSLHQRRRPDQCSVKPDVAKRAAILDDADGIPYPPRDPHDQGGGTEQANSAHQITPPVAPKVGLKSAHLTYKNTLGAKPYQGKRFAW